MKKRIPEQIESELARAGVTLTPEEMHDAEKRAEELYDAAVSDGRDQIDAYRAAMNDFDAYLAARTAHRTAPDSDPSGETAHAFSSIAGTLNTVMWLAGVMLYFLISFIFGGWHLTWLIFISAAAGSVIIEMIGELERGASRRAIAKSGTAVMWLAAVIVYFLASFIFGGWHLTWLIFVAAAAATVIINTLMKGDSD